MEEDESAACFDTIVCQSGQFGFFQKRLFIINTLIQSACISVIVYTCTCMPEVDEDSDACGDGFGPDLIFSNNGYHHNLTNEDGILADHHTSTAVVNSSLHHLLQNLTSLVPSLSTTTVAKILEKLTGASVMAENKTLASAMDFMIANATGSADLFVNASKDYISKTMSSLGSTVDPVSDHRNHTNAKASDILESYLYSIFENVGNRSEIQNESFPSSPNIALPLTTSPSLLHNPARNETVTTGDNDWPHLVDAVLMTPNESATIHQDITSAPLGYTSDFPLVYTSDFPVIFNNLSTASSSVMHSSYNICQRPFILLRTDLKKTQILDSMSLDDLVQLTFFGQGISVIVGSAVGSMAADMLGRRRLLYIALTGMLTMQCLLSVSISWVMFIFIRMLAVAFAGATMVVSSVVVIEFLGPDWRDACTCSCFWTFGAIVLSMETLVTVNWRWLALLSGGVCFPLIGTYFTSTESVRWLQCQHRFTEAEACFREVVSVNSSAVPDIMSLLDESRACIVHNMHHKRFTFLDLFHSIHSAKWTLTLIYTSIVSACVYFCLLLRVKEITGFVHFDVFLPFILDLPLTWSVIVVNRCLGRRWCLFLYSFASGFALLSVLILHVTGNVAHMPSLVTGLALFGKIGVTASLSLIFLIAIETFPTVTRCMGLAVALASASGGSMLSTALIFLEQYHYTVPFVVYGAMMASVGAVGLLFPETIRKPLKNVQQCRHRKIPLMEGARLVGRPPSMWDAV